METAGCDECQFHYSGAGCIVDPSYEGSIDPIAVAETIKKRDEKPQLPEKLKIGFTDSDEMDTINAIIDYLQAREAQND